MGRHGRKIGDNPIAAEHADYKARALWRAEKARFGSGGLARPLFPIELDPHRLAIFGDPGAIPVFELQGIVAAAYRNSHHMWITRQQSSFNPVSICAVDGNIRTPTSMLGYFCGACKMPVLPGPVVRTFNLKLALVMNQLSLQVFRVRSAMLAQLREKPCPESHHGYSADAT